MPKQRLSVSVDEELLEAGQRAVEAGAAPNLSAWVNAALRNQADRERRSRALDSFFAADAAEFGESSAAEVDRATQELLDRAIRVRDGETIYPEVRPRAS